MGKGTIWPNRKKSNYSWSWVSVCPLAQQLWRSVLWGPPCKCWRWGDRHWFLKAQSSFLQNSETREREWRSSLPQPGPACCSFMWYVKCLFVWFYLFIYQFLKFILLFWSIFEIKNFTTQHNESPTRLLLHLFSIKLITVAYWYRN